MNIRTLLMALACIALTFSSRLHAETEGQEGEEGQEASPRMEEPMLIPEDEPYRPLLENSPFLTLEFKRQLGASRNRGGNNLQFMGYAWADGQWVFGLYNRRSRESNWVPLGESFNRVRLVSFDEEERTLTVNVGGTEVQLKLQQ